MDNIIATNMPPVAEVDAKALRAVFLLPAPSYNFQGHVLHMGDLVLRGAAGSFHLRVPEPRVFVRS